MFLSRQIPRKFSAAVLCCLVLVGGLPRAWCLCPDAECRAACDAGLGPLATAAEEHAGCPHCRCHQKEQDGGSDQPGFSASQCPCSMHVAQAVLPSAGRDVEMPTASIAWLAPAEVEQGLSVSAERVDRSRLLQLPPDDPVSRAQILRL